MMSANPNAKTALITPATRLIAPPDASDTVSDFIPQDSLEELPLVAGAAELRLQLRPLHEEARRDRIDEPGGQRGLGCPGEALDKDDPRPEQPSDVAEGNRYAGSGGHDRA